MIGEIDMNSTITNDQQNIEQAFKAFLGIKSSDTRFFISGWVEINDNDIKTAIANKSGLDAAQLRRVFIDFIVQKINGSSHGAGCHYELYESRRQSSIKSVMASLSEKLSDSELDYFKRESGYEEAFKDEAGCCSECGEIITSYQLAYSLQYAGEELCSGCCHSAMI